jgi:tetratricopeptide (TPR) repeat protein
MGDKRGVAWNLHLMGMTDWCRGDYEEALRCYAEGMENFRQVRDPRGEAWSLDLSANVKLAQRKDGEAEELYERAHGLLEREGLSLQNRAWYSYHRGALAAFRGRSKEADDLFRQSLALFDSCRDTQGQAASRICLGDGARIRGAFRESEGHFREAARIALAAHLAPSFPYLLVSLAELLRAQGDERRAAGLLMVALAHPACRRQTQDRAVSLSLALQASSSPQEMEGALQWAKSASIREVLASWLGMEDGAGRKKKKVKTKGIPRKGRKPGPKTEKKKAKKTSRRK